MANDGWQEIHCKLVKSPHGLSRYLNTFYGDGKFSVETRQNVYCIKAQGCQKRLDVVSTSHCSLVR
ncbi:hypothetical protein CTAM01_16651 [Colletotrichum tamarilloi]|uniref:Uncharacterized protein n=1 Tax=Colletotrichum tamarilloi TaxID=1209934 RepID=A0ABQ9QHW7_9PEZI|nr:uncharacterized protein CTAM01_16651 [Colletotrichum tamarilloi]KAK1471153.1 hypothetical protein CTAM01_16651 [Colletotrichum tamarilloi]